MVNPYNEFIILDLLNDKIASYSYCFIVESKNPTLNTYFRELILNSLDLFNVTDVNTVVDTSISINKEDKINVIHEFRLDHANTTTNIFEDQLDTLIKRRQKAVIWIPSTLNIAQKLSVKCHKLFLGAHFNVPDLNTTQKISFLFLLLEKNNLEYDVSLKEYLIKEINSSDISIDHIINYVSYLKKNSPSKSTISLENLKYLGSLKDCFETIGSQYLSEYTKLFPNTKFEKLVRTFIVKNNNETLSYNVIELDELIKKCFDKNDKKKLTEFINIGDFNVLVQTNENNKLSIKINENYTKYWKELQQYIQNERIDANLYIQISKLALKYNNQIGELLSKSELIQASKLYNSRFFTLEWSLKYNKAFELVKKYIEISIEFNHQQELSQERKRKSQLKRARTTVLFVSGAFIISMILALFAYSSLQKAEVSMLEARENALRADNNAKKAAEEEVKAKSAKNRAEIFAEVSKQNERIAIIASEEAKLNAKKARISQMDAIRAGESAKIAMKQAIKNKELADIQRRNSEEKTKQEQARFSALSSLQNFANSNYLEGFNKAQLAYDLNIKNNGDPYQTEIMYALIKGYAFLHPTSRFINSNISEIKTSSNFKLVGIKSIDQSLRITSMKDLFSENEFIKIDSIRDYKFHSKDEIYLLKSNGNLYRKSYNKTELEAFNLGANNNTKFDQIIDGPELLLSSDNSIYQLYSSNKIENIKHSLSKNLMKNLQYDEHKKTFYSFEKNDCYMISFTNNELIKNKIISLDGNISCVSKMFDDNLMAIGLYDGSLVIINLANNTVAFNNKVHQSQLTNIHLGASKDKTIIATTSYDGQIKLFYGKNNEWLNNKYILLDNISTHKTWITDSCYLSDNSLISFDYSGVINRWELNLDKILNTHPNHETN